MMIFLLAVAVSGAPEIGSTGSQCHGLDESYVRAMSDRIADSVDIAPVSKELAKLSGYWQGVCAKERYEANKEVVRSISKLLYKTQDIFLACSMLINIGPNLFVSKRDLDAAISMEAAEDQTRAQAAFPMEPETAKISSYSLRCIKIKIATGKRDSKYCSFLEQ